MLGWLHPSSRRAALRRELRVQVSKAYWAEVGLRDRLRSAEGLAVRAEATVADLKRERSLHDAALPIVLEARWPLSPSMVRGLLADPPTTEDGQLDEVEFAGAVFDATVEVAALVSTLQGGQR